MASSKRPTSMEDLFNKQDREILADTITYGSGGIRFKGNASDALSLLNQLNAARCRRCDARSEIQENLG